MKNNFFPTQERLYRRHLAESNKCQNCSRAENVGHLLICGNSSIAEYRDRLITLIRTINPNVTLEHIIQFDLNMDSANIYSISTIIATFYECIISNKKKKIKLEENILKKALIHLNHVFSAVNKVDNYVQVYIKYILNI